MTPSILRQAPAKFNFFRKVELLEATGAQTRKKFDFAEKVELRPYLKFDFFGKANAGK